MVIGKHQPTQAVNRCWKDAIGITLDEATTALAESFCDLTDEQVWSRPLADRHSIGTMVMHCLENLNGFACWVQTGTGVEGITEEDWFNMWSHTPQELDARQGDMDLPSVAQMTEWARQVREAAAAGLGSATEEDLRGPRADSHWCQATGRTAGDAYFRTIGHVMAHTRQIWCLRGAMGAFGPDAWPQQHYA